MLSSYSANSLMRILFADPRCEQRIVIEKSPGLLGRFRVCSVVSFAEFTVLTYYHPSLYKRFDLLIINVDLLTKSGVNALDFCMNGSRLRHVLIYGSQDRRVHTQNYRVGRIIRYAC